MRKSLLIVFLFLLSGMASAACSNTSFGQGFTCIQTNGSANAGSGNNTITLGAATTAGHQVIVTALVCADASCSVDTTSITLTPSSGVANTFVAASGFPALVNSNLQKIGLWIVTSTTATTTFTVSCSTTCFYNTVTVSEWTGINTTTSFNIATAGSGSASPASQTSGTITTTPTLLFGFVELAGAGGAVTVGSGFTEIGQFSSAVQIEAQSITATGAQNCTWTFTSQPWQGLCVAVNQASGAANIYLPPRIM